MRSRELLRRLDRLKLPAKEAPKMVHDFGVLSRVEKSRFLELYQMLRDGDEELTEIEVEEFKSLLHRCPLVEPGKAGSPYAETNEERRERRALEWAFGGAFHDYARQYPFIAVPNYANLLNAYCLDLGYMSFSRSTGGLSASGTALRSCRSINGKRTTARR